MNSTGRLILVGAGPGDPELITVKGLKALRRADVVLYDRLANPALLLEAPQAELIEVGKHPGGVDASMRQAWIHELIVERAGRGETVVRLKGGDPFVFGRGGEEWEVASSAGINVEIVPGISSSISAPAFAGIPVTHRGISNAFGVFTGHEAHVAQDTTPWEVAAAMPTAMFLMSAQRLPYIVEKLLQHGVPCERPAAVVSCATLPEQKVVTGTLANIVERAAHLEAPAVTIVGGVVEMAARLRSQI